MTNTTNNTTANQVISMDKQYKTRSGKPVRILCTNRKDSMFPVVALVATKLGEGVICYDNYGEFDDEDISEFDLIEVTPFAEFKEGDKVMVRDHEEELWFPRYFKEVVTINDQHQAGCFHFKYNPWSNKEYCYSVGWKQCRFPTEEELNGSK